LKTLEDLMSNIKNRSNALNSGLIRMKDIVNKVI